MELGVERNLTNSENEELRCVGGCCGKEYTGIGPYGQFPMTINSYSRNYIPCCGQNEQDYVYSVNGLCSSDKNETKNIVENYQNSGCENNYYQYNQYLKPGIKVQETMAASPVFDQSGMGQLCKSCPLKNFPSISTVQGV